MLLKNILKIQTGVYLKPDRFGNAVYIKVNDFDENYQLSMNLQSNIMITQRMGHHLLQAGDVLFAAKGDYNFAAVYNNEYPSAIASSSFFVLKKSFEILSDYLAWFINHPDSQKKLKAEAKGSSIASISMKTLENLEIKIPDRETQESILVVDKLRKKEKRIQNELMMLKDQLIDTRILSRI